MLWTGRASSWKKATRGQMAWDVQVWRVGKVMSDGIVGKEKDGA